MTEITHEDAETALRELRTWPSSVGVLERYINQQRAKDKDTKNLLTTTRPGWPVGEVKDACDLWKIAQGAWDETANKNESVRDAWQRVVDKVIAATSAKPEGVPKECDGKEAMNLALEALNDSKDCVQNEYAVYLENYFGSPNRKAYIYGITGRFEKHKSAIAALESVLAQPEQQTEQPAVGDIADFPDLQKVLIKRLANGTLSVEGAVICPVANIAQPEQKTKWVEAAYGLYHLQAKNGEILESIRTNSYEGTATVLGSKKQYTTLAAAKVAVNGSEAAGELGYTTLSEWADQLTAIEAGKK